MTDAGREATAAAPPGPGTAAKPHDPAAYVRLESTLAMLLPPEAVVDAIGFSLGARMLLGVAASRPHSFGRIVVGGVGESVLRHDDPEPVARAIEGSADDAAGHPVAAGTGAGGVGAPGAGAPGEGAASV